MKVKLKKKLLKKPGIASSTASSRKREMESGREMGVGAVKRTLLIMSEKRAKADIANGIVKVR